MQTTLNQQTTEITRLNNSTQKELIDTLLLLTKSTVCNITYLVDDQRSKTIQGKKQVQKLVHCSNVYLNHDYQQKVNNINTKASITDGIEIAEIEPFVAMELKGKTRISSTLLRSDKTGELMLDGKILNSETTKILAYYHNGKEITEAEAISMELWTPAYYNPAPKVTMGRGLLSYADDFGIINPYISRITKIKVVKMLFGSDWVEC